MHSLRRIFSDKGFLLTLSLGVILLFVFYGPLLLHPSKTYFGNSGDGMQVYYETLYHTKYDTHFWKQQSINYPYGESIFFTSAMPMINNLVKLFGASATGCDVALINLLMLFSIVFGAVFLYGIFHHLRLPWLYSALSATAIAFFSPQIMRMTGHYSLSWVFFIPAMLFLLLRFYDHPSLRKSVVIAALSLLAATTHLYYFAFFAAISGIYWAALFISRDRDFGRLFFVVKHVAVQLLLPFLLVELLMISSDTANDRTHFPWGYFFFHSNATGVFYPLGKFYEPLFALIAKPELPETEGIAYIGLTGLIGLLAVIIAQLTLVVRRKFGKLFSVTDSKPMNIFFWTSLFILWISFGRPFIHGHEAWLTALGPLRQFRAIGRFNWIFFYVINIVAVYRIYTLSQNKKVLRSFVLAFIPLLLFTDMIPSTVKENFAVRLNNRIDVLEDETNQLPADAWLRNFKPEQYQAILPLPYFHVGSENLKLEATDPEIVKQSYIVSLKTGLPLMAVASSRTSISQTLKLLSLVMDPSQPLAVLKELPDQRPLLLVVRENALTENERRLVSLAKPVAESAEYKIYSLQPAAIAAMVEQTYSAVKTEMDSTAVFAKGDFRSTDSTAFFLHCTFDAFDGKPFRGKASFSSLSRTRFDLFDSLVPVAGQYRLTFWINKITGDVFPRTVIEVNATDPSGQAPRYNYLTNASICTKMIAGDWGLVEMPLTIPCAGAKLKITLWNDELRPDDVNQIDELLLIPAGTHLYQVSGDTIYRDNRRYFPAR